MIGKAELKELVRLFGYPCDLAEGKATIHANDCTWCEKHCGKATADECWQKYFSIIRRNEND